MPEPWAQRLVNEAGGKVLVDEATLWPEGKFVTTQLIAATDFIKDNPKTITNILKGNIEAIDFANANPTQAQKFVATGIFNGTGQKVDPATIANSWDNLTFTIDPLAATLAKSAKDAEERRPARPGEPQGDLRPQAAQQDPQGTGQGGSVRQARRRGGHRRRPRARQRQPANLSIVPDVRPEPLEAVPESSTLSTSTPVVPPATGAEVESSRVAPVTREPAVVLTDVSKVYGDASNAVHALDEVNLTVGKGEFVCLLGASGCGKSTLLNILAGLDRPSRGTSEVHGRTGLMFQESALFPWLTVSGNVDLALKLRKVPKAQRKARVAELLELVNLDGVREEASARALGRHASTRRACPCARAGCRRAAHGRAVRRARRDDPRHPARRARAHLAREATSRSCSSRTTCVKRCVSAIASCCSRADPVT